MVARLGDACSPERTCQATHECLALPGGSCAAACDGCEGSCVETLAFGERCVARCETDADCRVAEGYVCDHQACLPPNTRVPAARECPPPAGLGRDPAFGHAIPIATRGRWESSPSVAVAADGSALVLYASHGAAHADPSAAGLVTIELARIDAAGRVSITSVATTPHPDPQPQLARGRDRLHAVWLGAREVLYASSRDGLAWSTPIAVHAPEDCAGTDDCPRRPTVIAGEAVHVGYAANGFRVRSAREGDEFGPSRLATVGDTGDLALGPGGLHAIALDGTTRGAYGAGDHRVQEATDEGGRFGSPRRVDRGGEPLPYVFATPQVTIDDRRRWTYAAYVRGSRERAWDLALVATKEPRPGSRTVTRARLGDDGCALHLVPTLAVDPVPGTVHVAWFDTRGHRFAHATCTPGLGACRQLGRINDVPFAPPSLLPGSPRSVSERAGLAVDTGRRALHAVWAQPVQEGETVAARIFHARAKLPVR